MGGTKASTYDYTPINSLSPNPSVNFYGRVVAYKLPAPTRGTDYVMTMTVVDDSVQPFDDEEVAGLSVVIFRSDPSLFPAVHSEDEIVQCRHMRVQVFQGGLQALSTNWSAFTVFARNEQGQWISRPAREISQGEQSHLDRISARTGHTVALVRSSPTKPGASRKQVTIDLITPNIYFDLVAQVIHTLPAKQAQMTGVLLTDYTANLGIKVHPTDFGLSPDYEHRLLLTAFWDNFAARAAALRPGQIIRVINLRPKIIYDDGPGSGGLVAVLHGDPSSTEKIFLLSNDMTEARVILERRRELFGDQSELTVALPTQQTPTKTTTTPSVTGRSPAGGRIINNSGIIRPVSKRFMLFDTQPELEETSGLVTAIGDDDGGPRSATVVTVGGASVSPKKFHPLTTILHMEIPVTAIRTVLQATECPAKFVIKGRVQRVLVDRTGGYARRQCTNCHRAYARTTTSCLACQGLLTGWTFMFALAITDGFDELTVIVADQEAIRFLNGLQPSGNDENDDSASLALAYIEDVLGKLTGSALPASFCIKSYQVGGERRYRLFDTILAG